MDIQDHVLETIGIEWHKAKGWMKFLGIMSIIYGAIYCLTIVGITIGWFPIWMGILLHKAGNLAEDFAKTKDPESIRALSAKLRVVFTATGIFTIVSVVLSIIFTILLLIFGLTLLGGLSQLGQ